MCNLVHLCELWYTRINLIENHYTHVPIDDIHVFDAGFDIKMCWTVFECMSCFVELCIVEQYIMSYVVEFIVISVCRPCFYSRRQLTDGYET